MQLDWLRRVLRLPPRCNTILLYLWVDAMRGLFAAGVPPPHFTPRCCALPSDIITATPPPPHHATCPLAVDIAGLLPVCVQRVLPGTLGFPPLPPDTTTRDVYPAVCYAPRMTNDALHANRLGYHYENCGVDGCLRHCSTQPVIGWLLP